MGKITVEQALASWSRIKSGEAVVVSDEALDRLSDHFVHDDSEDADLFFRNLRTTFNPLRLGILDAYVATLNSSDKTSAFGPKISL